MTYHVSKHLRSGAGGLMVLSRTTAIKQYQPFFEKDQQPGQPKRKSLKAPDDNHTFVKPIKQCFIKNPRTMPMTRMMLVLLAGWAGQGGSIKTTTGIIGKHLHRCRRQVFRYLKDAEEEGYLFYSRTKDRIGRYTGIQIWLNFAAIRFNTKKPRKNKSQIQKSAQTLDVTYPSETNENYLYNKKKDPELCQKLEQLASTFGFKSPEMVPS